MSDRRDTQTGLRRMRNRRRERRGRLAETAAALWLRLKGYRVLARRVRTPFGEVDIVAARRGTLVAVEVKARHRAPADGQIVSPRQRQRIGRAAAWLSAHRAGWAARPWRFDIVLATRHPPRLRHVPGAWAIMLAAVMLATPACTPQGMAISLGAQAVTAARQERGFEQSMRDRGIELGVTERWFAIDHALVLTANATAHEGRVLLTGTMADMDTHARMIAAVRTVPGVREVIDETRLAGEVDAVDRARDEGITAAIRTRLLGDPSIASSNYDLDSVGGTVFLFGIARSRAEHERVVAHASDVRYVRGLKSHVRIAGPAGPAGQAGQVAGHEDTDGAGS